MLKAFRTNTKWIMIVVIVFFIGMIVFQWGMDITSTQQGVSAGAVGSVNGVNVPKDLYDAYVSNQQQQVGSGSQITYEQQRMLHDEIWNFMVTRQLIEQDIEKRGITYSDHELVNFMLNNPIQIASQVPVFLDDAGAFSIDKYRAFIRNPMNKQDPQSAQLLQYIEAEATARLPEVKFQMRLTESIVISDAQVREEWLKDNEKRSAEWMFVSVDDQTRIAQNIDPDAISAYYSEHGEDFRRGERRILDGVFLSLETTSADSADVLERTNLIVQRARSGEDFAELANGYSEDPGNQSSDGTPNGGNIGYVSKNMLPPEFENVAFALKPGEISDPVLTPFGYHVITVDSLKYSETDSKVVDQVLTRHILLKLQPSFETRDAVDTKVREFFEAVTAGEDFDARVASDGLSLIQTDYFEKDATIVGGVSSTASMLVHRAFRAKMGDMLNPFVTDNGYYLFRVSQIRAAGIPPLDEVSAEIEIAVRKEQRAEKVLVFVKNANDRLKSGEKLSNIVRSDSLIVANTMAGEVTRNHFVAGLGSMNPLMARIFSLKNSGDITGPVITDSGVGIAVLLETLPIDEEKFEAERDTTRNKIRTAMNNDFLSRYIEGLRAEAKIVDNRDMFFGL